MVVVPATVEGDPCADEESMIAAIPTGRPVIGSPSKGESVGPMIDIPPEVMVALDGLTPAARVDLMLAWCGEEKLRQERIRRLCDRDSTCEVAELLIDLDGDPWMHWIVMEALMEALRGCPPRADTEPSGYRARTPAR
jgi:hypothetical protein